MTDADGRCDRCATRSSSIRLGHGQLVTRRTGSGGARRRYARRYGIPADAVAVRRVRRADAGEADSADSRGVPRDTAATRRAHACCSPAREPRTPTSPPPTAADVADRVTLTGLCRTTRRSPITSPPVRRQPQPALADRARNLRPVAARARRRASRRSSPTSSTRPMSPSLDPRTWTVNEAVGSSRDAAARRRRAARASTQPVAIAIDILDEDHSLRLAMRRLATDADAARDARAAPRGTTGSASTRSRRWRTTTSGSMRDAALDGRDPASAGAAGAHAARRRRRTLPRAAGSRFGMDSPL